MYILGYSGLDNAAEFKKQTNPPLSKRESRFFQGMDSAAALLLNGKVIAAIQEERLIGEKYAHKFPVKAIKYCLGQAGIGFEDISFITHGFNYEKYEHLFNIDEISKRRYMEVFSPNKQRSLFEEYFNLQNIKDKFVSVEHHDAHAASTFYFSGFDKALVCVIDGLGELQSLSVFMGEKNKLQLLENYDIFSSLGLFYSLITCHLGFLPNSGEYKVMGLAPYGNPRRFLPALKKCVTYTDNGEIEIPIFYLNNTREKQETYRGSRDWLSTNIFPERNPDEEIQQHHKDLAAAAQIVLMDAVTSILTYWRKKTNLNRLCLAGGVALNCVMNSYIKKAALFNDIFVQPASGDEGTSLGSALFLYFKINPNASNPYKKDLCSKLPLWGNASNDQDIQKAISYYSDRVSWRLLTENELIKETCDRIESGEIIAWVQGRMEFGPRALGNRSILADPRAKDMRTRINQLVKKREGFRPFAPSVKEEAAHVFFDTLEGERLPYMLFTVSVKEEYKDRLPAVVHIDGSARVQTVNKGEHRLYWKLLDAFEHKTGFPILLNTSFNVMEQPIVCTPIDAIETFFIANLSGLVMGNYFLTKK